MKKMGYITFILVTLLGGGYLFRESKVKNVFDEIYHTRTQPISNLYTTTSFADLKIAGVIRNTQINIKEEHISKLMQESYLETTLKKMKS